jgi:hypothetical protein
LARDDSDPPQKKKLIAAGVCFLIAIGVGWYLVGGKTVADIASERMFMCSQTGKTWPHELREGEIEPIYSSFSKKNTGWLAERCYWKKMPDGSYRAKKKPTYVILKKRMDPDTEEKTYCPDCEREVVGHNPMPPEDEMAKAVDK